MKKTLTIFTLLLISMAGYAQRNIDWSLDEIVTPGDLLSDPSVGTLLTLDLVAKNLGPDAAKIGDTLLYYAAVLSTTNQLIFDAPAGALANGTRYLQILTSELAMGDTVHIKRGLRYPRYVTQSLDIKIGIRTDLLNRTDAIAMDPVSANNEKLLEVVWFNPYNNGVSVSDVKYNDNIAVYPNPATDVLNVKLLLTQVSDVTIDLVDLNGKVVVSQTVGNAFESNAYKMNVEGVENGIYILKVTNGTEVSTTKVTITR